MPAMRKSAEVRREEILAVAIEHFAEGGYHGTSTEVIAKEAGISQPYLFRLFRTKRELFLACDDRACEKVIDAFRRAAVGAPEGEKLHAMGQAYVRELLPDRHAILMLMQSYVARRGPRDPRARAGQATATSSDEVAELAGAGPTRSGASSPSGCC